MSAVSYTYLDSPVGRLRIVAGDDAICGIYYPDHTHPPRHAGEERETELLRAASQQLMEYFAGTRARFELPLDPIGSAFQRAVWNVLREIPFGAHRSYADVARAVGDPRACRAVGAANGRNPISIVIPCHRVIGSDGSLTGYAGGAHNKRWLLDHEAQHAGQRALF